MKKFNEKISHLLFISIITLIFCVLAWIMGVNFEKTPPFKNVIVPATESDWYVVHGMGRSIVYVEQKRVLFGGSSVDYGIGISDKHLDSMRLLLPDWKLEEGSFL